MNYITQLILSVSFSLLKKKIKFKQTPKRLLQTAYSPFISVNDRITELSIKLFMLIRKAI